MKAFRLLLAAAVFLSIILTTAGFHSVLATTSPREHRSYILKSQSQKLTGIASTSVVVEEAHYLAAVHHPVTTNEAVNERIALYVAHKLQQLFAEALELAGTNATPGWRRTLYSDYEVFAYDADTVSFRFDTSIYGGGGAPRRQIATHTFNLNHGTELSVQELFATGYEAKLAKYLPTPQPIEHFVFTPTHLVVYLPQQGSLQSVEVPLTELAGVVNFKVLNGADPHFSSPPQRKAPRIALTFDDGPHPQYTAQILDELRHRNAVATFFVLGERVEANPRLMRRIVREGSEVGNHTWDHPNLTKLTAAEVAEQFARTNAAIYKTTGLTPKVSRPPYGFYNETVRAHSTTPLVRWSIDPKDWDNQDVLSLVQHVVTNAGDGDIILLHDIYPTTVEAAVAILDQLTAKGYEFVTVSELLSLSDYPHTALSGRIFPPR